MRKLIGVGCVALGLFALWASPFSTVSCSRGADGVSCHVGQALLGLVPLSGVDVKHVLHAGVSYTDPAVSPSRRATANAAQGTPTYQLEFTTAQGRVAPRGVDASSSDPLRGIAAEVNDLVSGDGGPFTERNYNGFPNVFGAIFFFLGILIVFNG